MRTAFAFLLLSTLTVACGDDIKTPGTIRGSITGLRGTGLVLGNHGDILEMTADGSFQFGAPVALGTTYDISIVSQPSSPWQTCKVLRGTGRIDEPGQTIDIGVTCKTDTYAVAGTVTGLAGTGLVLQNNGGDDIAVATDGKFAFATPVTSGAPFEVSVKQQPTGKSQTCSVSGGAGTIGGNKVDTVVVNCATDRFVVGGTIQGLRGTVVLENNHSDAIEVSANGTFAFPSTIASGDDYDVRVAAQPGVPSQTCVVSQGSGQVIDQAIEAVTIDCTTNTFAVGGTVVGLAGDGLVLENNAGDPLPVTAAGTFVFPTEIESGAAFSVTVAHQPTGLSQTCDVVGGGGVVGGGPVTTVTVNCETNTYAVGGLVAGLAGGMVRLQNNGGDEIRLMSNGSFAFPVTVASGGLYAVTVSENPTSPSQTCTVVGGGEGAVVDAAITTVEIACTVNTFAVGGTISGLAAGNTVVLRNSDGEDFSVSANGPFAAPVEVASGQTYNIAVVTSPDAPIAQACTVADGSGTVADAAVTSVAITCTTRSFAVGGTVTGLLDETSVVLTDGIEDITVSADGTFAFAALVASGASYAVTVKTPPEGLGCRVTGGSGTMGSAPADVTVTCGKSITKWSEGTEAWPDQACNPISSFGSCSTNAQDHADAWAAFVCKQNGYSDGHWTGNKAPGCSGEVSMYCGGEIPCTPNWELSCQEGDQTKIELTCDF
jgi:hypothetical protein